MTSAPTPVTTSVRSQLRTSIRIDSETPSAGIHWYSSKGMSPANTAGAATIACAKAIAGRSAAT